MTIAPPYTDESLCRLLEANGIDLVRAEHPAVYTCEELARLVPETVGGVHTKNLFLRDGKGRRHWLLVTSCAKAVDLKGLVARIGADNLSLGSSERLRRYLGVEPGSVTVFALANDPAHAVTLLVDREVWAGEAWRCHPLVNTATLVVSRRGVERFLQLTGHPARVIDVPARG